MRIAANKYALIIIFLSFFCKSQNTNETIFDQNPVSSFFKDQHFLKLLKWFVCSLHILKLALKT